MHNNKLKKVLALTASSALLTISQMSFAHTRLEIPQIDEGTRVYNNEIIGHGCTDPATDSNTINTVGTVVVFPDGIDSTLTVNGEASDLKLTDVISGWGVGKVQDKDVFSLEEQIKDPNGNTIGYWTAGAPGLTAGFVGRIPFRTNAVTFSDTSCAKSVQFRVAIADVCGASTTSGFAESNVKLWVPAVGSNFDNQALDGYDSPATLTINRTSSLPANCGDGDTVVVNPSAEQLNRNLPVVIDGVQIWPTP